VARCLPYTQLWQEIAFKLGKHLQIVARLLRSSYSKCCHKKQGL